MFHNELTSLLIFHHNTYFKYENIYIKIINFFNKNNLGNKLHLFNNYDYSSFVKSFKASV